MLFPDNVTNSESIILTHEQMLVISYIDIATATLSIFGAGSVVTAACCYRKSCNPDIHPIMHLSMGDLLASVALFVSAISFIKKTVNIIEYCAYTSGFTNALFVTTFFLTFVYALQVYLRLRHARKNRDAQWQETSPHNCAIRVLYIISWCAPILTILSVLLPMSLKLETKDNPIDSPCSTCLPIFHYRLDNCSAIPNDSATWWVIRRVSFMVPLLTVMVLNTFLYILTVREYHRFEAARGVLTGLQHKVTRKIRSRAMLYMGVFFFCWTPSLLLAILTMVVDDFKMNDFYPLYIIQALTAPLQGFINSLVYAWKRKSFTGALRVNGDGHRGGHYPSFLASARASGQLTGSLDVLHDEGAIRNSVDERRALLHQSRVVYA